VIAPAPEPRAFAYGDFPLGPVWIDAGDAKGAGARSLAAIASRETLELAVVDLAAALRSKAGEGLPVRSRAQLPARPRAIASGDLGRDGRADVAVVTIDEELLVYAASDLSAPPRRIPLPREHAVALLVASDGERIAVGFQGSRKIAILRSDGTGRELHIAAGDPARVLEADLDGDGDTELAVAAGDDSLVVFGLGRPGGPARWLASSYAVTTVGTVPIALAAMRGSGRSTSIAVLDLHAQDVRLLDFAKGPAAPLDLRAAGQRPTDLAVGDFDGDGALDLAIANGDSRRVGLLFGAGGKPSAGKRFDSETRVPCDRSPASVAAGDVDGDGRADVAVLAAADETLAVLANERGALARRSAAIPAPGASSVACADLDGDGRAEVACLQHGAAGSIDRVRAIRSAGDRRDDSRTIGAGGSRPRPHPEERPGLRPRRAARSERGWRRDRLARPIRRRDPLRRDAHLRRGQRSARAGSAPRKEGELRVAVADGGGGRARRAV
jgi:hypothetical protein